MSVARQQMTVALPPDRAMALWVDPQRWLNWVDGFQRLVDQPAGWPGEPHAKVVWESRPGGRGRVTERVVEHSPPRRFVADVYEDRMVGRQTVTFEPAGAGTVVAIELRYTLTKQGPLRPITDFFFIRPRLRESQWRMLKRFATEAAEEASLPEP